MTTVPIIIPVQQTKIVNCIIQDGIRYCENTKMTSSDLKMASIIIVIMLLWFIGIVYLLINKDKPLLALGLFFLPFILVILFL